MTTSTAVSAQGTIHQIATGTAGAKNASAIALGNPTIITSAAHGLSNGDVVAAAAFTGANAASINSLSWTVIYKTTNTVAIALDSTALTITVGSGTLTPTTYTAIANVKSGTDLESGSSPEIDVTDLTSTAKEFRLGLVDNGSYSLTLFHSNADAGQAALQARRLDGAAVNMKVILPSGTTPTASFSALIKKFSKSVAVDGVVEASVDIRVNGVITWA
jgi:hypothetical protein